MTATENDTTRLLQLCETLSATLGKLEPSLLVLQEATKALATLSQSTEAQMKATFTIASATLAETVAQEITSKAESQINEILSTLDRSVQYALRTLHDTKCQKRLRLAGFFCLSCLVVGLIGFGTGYFYSDKIQKLIFLRKNH